MGDREEDYKKNQKVQCSGEEEDEHAQECGEAKAGLGVGGRKRSDAVGLQTVSGWVGGGGAQRAEQVLDRAGRGGGGRCGVLGRQEELKKFRAGSGFGRKSDGEWSGGKEERR